MAPAHGHEPDPTLTIHFTGYGTLLESPVSWCPDVRAELLVMAKEKSQRLLIFTPRLTARTL